MAGNVPGFRTAVASVQDRSKPFVGALVLEQLYGKFQDRWIVELLFDVRSVCLRVCRSFANHCTQSAAFYLRVHTYPAKVESF